MNIKSNLVPEEFKVLNEESDNQVLYLSYQQNPDEASDAAFVQIMNPLDPLGDGGELQSNTLQTTLYSGIGDDLQKASIDDLDQSIQLQVNSFKQYCLKCLVIFFFLANYRPRWKRFKSDYS